MINDTTKATVITAAIFVALLSEHVTIAVMCGMALIYVLMKSMVEPNEADKKAAGVGDTDDSDK
ncbi:hypothetical protein [Limosilactobacillus pontis]|uniref:Uncharacterized protein n=1 Tax=Limosilactobacillus pontis TaxID=35787 RepID=A0ABU7SUS4_9LACO